jgi:hypothetical protein
MASLVEVPLVEVPLVEVLLVEIPQVAEVWPKFPGG